VTTAGEVGNRYALIALAEATGGPEAVWQSLLRTNSPGYGWMLTMGETALAESWTDARGDSHLHAMYGHIDEYASTQKQIPRPLTRSPPLTSENPPGPWTTCPAPLQLYKYVAGLQQAPGGTGWREVVFAPHPPFSDGAGAFVRATFDSPRGRLVSHCVVGAGSSIELRLTCPVGVRCRARGPVSGNIFDVPATGREQVFLDSK